VRFDPCRRGPGPDRPPNPDCRNRKAHAGCSRGRWPHPKPDPGPRRAGDCIAPRTLMPTSVPGLSPRPHAPPPVRTVEPVGTVEEWGCCIRAWSTRRARRRVRLARQGRAHSNRLSPPWSPMRGGLRGGLAQGTAAPTPRACPVGCAGWPNHQPDSYDPPRRFRRHHRPPTGLASLPARIIVRLAATRTNSRDAGDNRTKGDRPDRHGRCRGRRCGQCWLTGTVNWPTI